MASLNRALAAAILFGSALAPAQWASAPPVVTPRASFTATRLNDGRVLVTGGYAPVTATTELFNPGTNMWNAGPNLPVFRFFHSATLLSDGGVLIVGGDNGNLLGDAVRFNPGNNTFTAMASLDAGRSRHSAVLLRNGMVLVAGGQLSNGATAKCDLWNPATNRWRSTGALSVPRYFTAMVVLADGRVVLTGGSDAATFFPTAEIYDPVSETWSLLPPLNFARDSHAEFLLDDGSVLVVGNRGSDPGNSERWAPDASSWQLTPMLIQRFAPFASMVDGGRVVVAGGYASDAGQVNSSEVYDPATDRWYRLGDMATGGYYGRAVTLVDGRVIAVGGQVDGTTILGRCESFVMPPFDAGIDAGFDAGTDAGFDAGVDAGLDAGRDAGLDAGPVDGGVDAGPSDGGVDAGVEVDGGNVPEDDAGTSGRANLQVGCGCTTGADAVALLVLTFALRRRREFGGQLSRAAAS